MELLKDRYNTTFINQLAGLISESLPAFEQTAFINKVFDEDWNNKELKQRMRHITHALQQHLPLDYPEKIEVLKKVAPQFTDFTAMLFPDFVETYGLEYEELSLNALEFFTRYSSSEFAIRPFILKYTENTMNRMLQWSKHENHHVRRLSSEGCRPRLPWAMALPAFKSDPSPILPILENLRTDESDYVRRSVANNLNDIAKDHPDLVLDVAKKWKGKNKSTDWIVKHACRSLLKQGNKDAMELFGFKHPDYLKLVNFELDKTKLPLGDTLGFSFDLSVEGKKTSITRLEYGIYYQKANGKLSKKVFQISEKKLAPGKLHHYNKKQLFKDLSTRKHYAGAHKISIIVNGVELTELQFELIV